MTLLTSVSETGKILLVTGVAHDGMSHWNERDLLKDRMDIIIDRYGYTYPFQRPPFCDTTGAKSNSAARDRTWAYPENHWPSLWNSGNETRRNWWELPRMKNERRNLQGEKWCWRGPPNIQRTVTRRPLPLTIKPLSSSRRTSSVSCVRYRRIFASIYLHEHEIRRYIRLSQILPSFGL